ncbi:Lrp/AsnC family transcriptional regulator [Microbaculum marinum]|uniref:Lrp/AsnC family transcriptional regulator n=1 Tax=Microbaculum marinum TaxID=1764581 RepID=A0AAW9RM74_9HYPH
MAEKIDDFDRRILTELQRDGGIAQRELAERVGLSQNACWRRLQRLHKSGLVDPPQARIDLARLGLDLTVFVMIRTRHHSMEWARQFCRHVESLPEVTDFYRMGGDWDYLLRVVTDGMAGYDRFYQKLISDQDLETVSGYFPMETIFQNRPIDLIRVG